MKIKAETAEAKLLKVEQALNEAFNYFKSKEHDPEIINCRDITRTFMRIAAAREHYTRLKKSQWITQIKANSTQ